MLLGFKIWPRSVVLNPLQFHKHFGIEICYLLLLNFDMTSMKTTNTCMLLWHNGNLQRHHPTENQKSAEVLTTDTIINMKSR